MKRLLLIVCSVACCAGVSNAQYPTAYWPDTDEPPLFEVYALASGMGTVDPTPTSTVIIHNPVPGQDLGFRPSGFASGARVGLVWRHQNIGLIADGKSKGNYSEKDAFKVLDSVLSLLDTVDRKLGQLAKADLEKEDRNSLEQMRKLSALLRQQGKVLQTYWDSGREDDAAKYEDIRKDSWAVISKLLGIRG